MEFYMSYLTTFDCTKKCMQDLSIENVNMFCDFGTKIMPLNVNILDLLNGNIM